MEGCSEAKPGDSVNVANRLTSPTTMLCSLQIRQRLVDFTASRMERLFTVHLRIEVPLHMVVISHKKCFRRQLRRHAPYLRHQLFGTHLPVKWIPATFLISFQLLIVVNKSAQ